MSVAGLDPAMLNRGSSGLGVPRAIAHVTTAHVGQCSSNMLSIYDAISLVFIAPQNHVLHRHSHL